jgi:hypothetical protein
VSLGLCTYVPQRCAGHRGDPSTQFMGQHEKAPVRTMAGAVPGRQRMAGSSLHLQDQARRRGVPGGNASRHRTGNVASPRAGTHPARPISGSNRSEQPSGLAARSGTRRTSGSTSSQRSATRTSRRSVRAWSESCTPVCSLRTNPAPLLLPSAIGSCTPSSPLPSRTS